MSRTVDEPASGSQFDPQGLILRRIEDLHDGVSDLKTEVATVKALAIETNGKVRGLERWRAKIEGIVLALRGIPMIFSAVAACAAVGAFVVMLTH